MEQPDIPTIKLGEVLNYKWLRDNNSKLLIRGGKQTWELFFICKRIRTQIPFDINPTMVVSEIMAITPDLSRRTVFHWVHNGWSLEKCYPKVAKKFMEGLPETAKKKFFIQAHSKVPPYKFFGECEATIADVESKVLVKHEEPQIIDVQQAITEHTLIKAKVENPEPPPDDVEKRALDACQMFATGMVTIVECCESKGISYSVFTNVCNQSERCAKAYEQAIRLANVLNNGRQIALLDTALVHILTERKHTTETIYYEKVTIPGSMHPVWREKKKAVTKRDLLPGEMIMVKALLLKNLSSITMAVGGDEFTNMTEEQLLSFILEQDNIKALIESRTQPPTQKEVEKIIKE